MSALTQDRLTPEREGKLLFSEINWMPGHSPDSVQ